MTRYGIRYDLNQLEVFQDCSQSNNCWYGLFKTGIVASATSSQPQSSCRGLELDFKHLLLLSAVEYPVFVDSGLVLMGYSTALVPIELDGDGNIMWHLEIATDDFQLEVSDLETTKGSWFRTTDLEYLQSRTAILGWCSEAETLLGTDYLKQNVTTSEAKIKPYTWHWGGANLQFVAQSASPLALGGQLGLSFERTVNTLRFDHSTNYFKCVFNSARQQIVLYDVQAKRAWLVSLLSVLHHMLLVWSRAMDEEFRVTPVPAAQPGPDCDKASSDALLQNGSLVIGGTEAHTVTVQALIMEFSVKLSQATRRPPKRSKIYGYEFMDIVMDSPTVELKETTLKKEGLAWMSLLHETKCLICSDLGDAIVGKRSPWPLSPCNTLMKGSDLMAASIRTIETLSERHRNSVRLACRRLSNDCFWYPEGSPFQTCQHNIGQTSCWDHPGSLKIL